MEQAAERERVLVLAEHLMTEGFADNEADARLAALLILAEVDREDSSLPLSGAD